MIREIAIRIRNKLSEDRGSIYIMGMWVMLILVLVASVYTEYKRINNVLNTVDRAYGRAMTSVAVDNYDVVFESVREEDINGGYFEGGNEGENDSYERPTYFDENDYGEIEDELEALLSLEKIETGLIKLDEDDDEEYSIGDFEIAVKKDTTSADNSYKVYGKLKMEIPIYFLRMEVTRLRLTVNSEAVWRTRW